VSTKRSLVIADDHEVVRDGVVRLLQQFDLTLLGEASDGLEAIGLCKHHQPDLLLADVSMPRAGALEIIEEIRRWSPQTKIVVFTGITSSATLQPLDAASVEGIVLKDSPAEVFQSVVEQVLAGDVARDPAVVQALNKPGIVDLTRREQQVMGFLLRGYSNAAIADELNISAATVNNHRANLMRKLDVHSITELMGLALREGLLDANAP